MGLQGENGLGPETSILLLPTYLLLVLVYMLEVVFSKETLMEKLDRTYIQFIKQSISLPVIVAEPAVSILSRAMSITIDYQQWNQIMLRHTFN